MQHLLTKVGFSLVASWGQLAKQRLASLRSAISRPSVNNSGARVAARSEQASLRAASKFLIKFIEKLLGLLKVARIESLGEPVVDFSEHVMRLLAAAFRCEQPREAHGCA
jgi:hypothetical protein